MRERERDTERETEVTSPLSRLNEFIRSLWQKFAQLAMSLCNDRGLGPGLEAGPRLDKRGSPRGLVKLVCWSLLVVCGC